MFRAKWRPGWGWLRLVAALAMYLFLASVDQRLKVAPHAGFVPEDAAWHLQVADLPEFWQRATQVETAKAALSKAAEPLYQLQLALRRMTGIRLTPARWGLWFGPQLLAAQKDGEFGGCIRPGLMLRLVDWMYRLASRPSTDDGIRRYGETYYAWRDGFILFSSSPTYVISARQAPAIAFPTTASDRLTLGWEAPAVGELTVTAASGFPLEGWVRAPVKQRAGTLTLGDWWPEEPTVSVAATRWEYISLLGELVSPALEWLPGDELVRASAAQLAASWGLYSLRAEPGFRTSECALAWLGLEAGEHLPVPFGAAAIRLSPDGAQDHPLLPLTAGQAVIPYTWGEIPGWIMPLVGEEFSLCLATVDGVGYATTQEPLMAKLLASKRPLSEGLEGVLRVSAHWRKIAEATRILAQWALGANLWSEASGEDAAEQWQPWIDAAAELGVLRLRGQPGPNGMLLDGGAAVPETAP